MEAFPTLAALAGSTSATVELQKLLTVPPLGWNPLLPQSPEQRSMAIAHAALQALRESGDESFLFLRTILEALQQQQLQNAQNCTTPTNVFPEELIFHCITGCRHATLVRWASLLPSFRNTLRNLFMMLGQEPTTTITDTTQPQQHYMPTRTLQLACYTTCACFWKRDWNSGKDHGEKFAAPLVPNAAAVMIAASTAAAATAATSSGGGGSTGPPEQTQFLLESIIMKLFAPQLPTLPSIIPLPITTSPPVILKMIIMMIQHQEHLFDYWKSVMLGVTAAAATSGSLTYATLTLASSAATFVTVLLGEFVGKSRVPYQMPLEFHRQAHMRFESDGWLDQCLEMNLTALGPILTHLVQLHGTTTDATAFDSSSNSPLLLSTALAILTCLNDVVNWEFGSEAWESMGLYQQQQNANNASNSNSSGKVLLRPPAKWRNALLQPELWQGLLQVYPQLVIRMANTQSNTPMSAAQLELGHRVLHALSELILALASLQGPIWPDNNHRLSLCSYMVQGTLQLLTTLSSHLPLQLQQQQQLQQTPTELTQQVWLDALTLVNRIIVNFQWSTLSQLPTTSAISPLVQLVQAISSVASALWQAQVSECEALEGDLESMEYGEWREEALASLLDGLVLLVAGGALDKHYQHGMSPSSVVSDTDNPSWALAEAMGSVYSSFVVGRVRMAQWEEQYLATSEQDDDADNGMLQREEISAGDLQEEMSSVATIGRWHLGAALICLSSLAATLFPQLQAMWADTSVSSSVDVTPQAAALLEGLRLWSMCLGHLITDDNTGETPIIPEAIITACQENGTPSASAAITTQALVSAMQVLRSMAEEQVSKLMINPHDPRLSPLLATSLLWTLQRWAPAYILPVDWGTGRSRDAAAPAASKPSSVLAIWSGPEPSQQAVTFCLGLCLHYQCYWPQERQVQENASLLLTSLAKRSELRPLMVQSSSLHQLVALHCLTAGLRHGAPPAELQAIVSAKLRNATSSTRAIPPNEMIQGFHRLPYKDRSRILTAILLTCCDTHHTAANTMWNESITAVGEAFQSLVLALSSKQVGPTDVHAREMTCLCVEMFRGIARSSEITDPERISQFITPTLRPWSVFMTYYAQDLTVCEGLLGFFRDYAEQFVAFLNRDQCLVLFETSADLLKAYATVQSGASTGVARSIRAPSPQPTVETVLKEEQSYNDVLCAIELLIHLGTKDFLDICSSNNPDGAVGVESKQITDIIFFGLQQIIPLMTQGLLQYPTLCIQYFSLVGFMMDTYQEQVSTLPLDLFHTLVESLLWGLSHHDAFVSKSCLQGIGSLVREHLKSGRVLLHAHLVQRPDLFDTWNRRLLQDVVLQPIVWDRLEPTGMALLPLAAIDLDRFAAILQDLALSAFGQQHPNQAFGVTDTQQRSVRIQGAMHRLLQPDVVAKVGHGGYEGRMNRIRFKKDFEVFVQEIHSFLFLA